MGRESGVVAAAVLRVEHQRHIEHLRLELCELRVGAEHVEQILGLYYRQTGRSLDLPGGLKAFRVYEGVMIKKAMSRKPQEAEEGPDRANNKQEALHDFQAAVCLDIPGEDAADGRERTVKVPGGRIKMRLFSYRGEGIEEKKYTKWMDYDKIKSGLFIRTRKTGDYMQITGEWHRKKLSRILMDDRIPREERDGCLLIAQGPEILWIIGGRMSEKVKIMPDTVSVLEIQYQEE